MRFKTFFILSTLFASGFTFSKGFDSSRFAHIPIQHEGRIKPIDSFARVHLLIFYQKSKFHEQSAYSWLLQMLLHPEDSYTSDIFKVRTKPVLEAIGVAFKKSLLYSVNDLSKGLRQHQKLIRAIRNEDQPGPVSRQLLRLYDSVNLYVDLSMSLRLFIPDIVMEDPELAGAFGFHTGSKVSYYDLIKNKHILLAKFSELEKNKNSVKDKKNDALLKIMIAMYERSQRIESRTFTIIPTSLLNPWSAKWKSPFSVIENERASVEELQYMDFISTMIKAIIVKDQQGFDAAFKGFTAILPNEVDGDLEVLYNKIDLLYISLYFYIGALLFVICYSLIPHKYLHISAAILIICGFSAHFIGIILRMIIMGRPPVSTLYESIVFAGFVSVVFGLIIEYRKKDMWGLMTAAAVGSVLQFIGIKYLTDGDTMGMLVAVLDSNFWLSTHVVSITIGYGCALVAGIFGHIFMFSLIKKPSKKETISVLFKRCRNIVLIALFFTTLGTILGGIWADQSWGRFWGWDPKENGALLIVLWLLLIIHGYFSKQLHHLGFAFFLMLTPITVALAWFGVNLLSVGLHSYGFTDSIALNLLLFCAAELGLATTGLFIARAVKH